MRNIQRRSLILTVLGFIIHLITAQSQHTLTTNFNKMADLTSTSLIFMRLNDVTDIECSHACLEQKNFGCLSFDYEESRLECRLFDNYNDSLVNATGINHYVRLYVENLSCNTGWFQDGLSCYQAAYLSETYIQAEINCRESHVGGHLVSINRRRKRLQKDLFTELLTSTIEDTSPIPMFIYEGMSYFVVNRRKGGTGANYDEAKDLCTSKFRSEAKLVTIENSNLMELITSILERDLSEIDAYTERYWIGLTCRKGRGTKECEWQNGDALDYSNWDVGQPGPYECVALNYDANQSHSYWFTVSCSVMLSAICEAPTMYSTWIKNMDHDGWNVTTGLKSNITDEKEDRDLGECPILHAGATNGSFTRENCSNHIPYVCEYELGTAVSSFTSTPSVTLQTNNVLQIDGITRQECQTRCLQERKFFCRSYQFQKVDITRGVCKMSLENTLTVAPVIIGDASGVIIHTYYERNVCGLTCQNDATLNEITCDCLCLEGWFGTECEYSLSKDCISCESNDLKGGNHCVKDDCFAPLRVDKGQTGYKDSQTDQSSIYSPNANIYENHMWSIDWTPTKNESVPIANISLNATTLITGVSIYGGENKELDYRVTQFWLEFANKDNQDSKEDVSSENQTNILAGNFIEGFTRTHFFDLPFLANQVFVHISNYHNGIAMAIQLYGCERPLKAETIHETSTNRETSTGADNTTHSVTTISPSSSSSVFQLSTATSFDKTLNLLNGFKDNLTKEELIDALAQLDESLRDREEALDEDAFDDLLNLLKEVGRAAADDIESAKAVLNVYDNLADPEKMGKIGQQNDQKTESDRRISNLMKGIEDLSTHMRLPNGTDDIKLETINVVIGVTRVPQPTNGEQSVVALGNTEEVGCVLLPVLDTPVQLSTVVFKTLHNIMDMSNESAMASSVISLTASALNQDPVNNGDPPVSIQFSDDKPVTFDLKNRKDLDENSLPGVNAECVYWDDQERGKHKWSTEGCKTISDDVTKATKCACNHMTSFAVLFRVTDVEEAYLSSTHDVVLEYLTIVGLGLSVVGLLTTFVVYAFFKLFRHQNVVIHGNLIVSLLVAHSLFLCGIKLTPYPGICKGVAMLLHYFLLVSFAWMMIEGVHLFLKSSVSFRKNIKIWTYCLIGWGIPFVIVCISFGAGFDVYAAKNWCWLSNERGLIWAFVAPVLFVLLVNCIVLVLVMRVFLKLKTNKDKNELNRIRAGMRAVLTLQPILGLNWLFGLLSMTAPSVVFDYLFVICTSLQGIFIFILHCVLNEEVRKSLRMRSGKVSSSLSGSHSVSANPSTMHSRLETKSTVANISTADQSGFGYSKVTTKNSDESTA